MEGAGPWECDVTGGPSVVVVLKERVGEGPEEGWLDPEHQLGWHVWNARSQELELLLNRSPRAVWSALRVACNVAAWKAGGLLFHATGLLDRAGRGVVGLAASGGGKSTLTDLAEGFSSLSDETVFVQLAEKPIVHGLPFRSSATKRPEKKSGGLGAFLILEKSPEASFERVPGTEALRPVLAQLYRPPKEIVSSAEILRRARQLVESVPAYRFRFPKSAEAGRLLDRFAHEELDVEDPRTSGP